MEKETESIRIFVAVISAALCVVAMFGLVRVLGDSEPGMAIAKTASVAGMLILFSPIGLAGVVLAVRRPELAWFGYATTAIAFLAFIVLTRHAWEENGILFFGSNDWELPTVALFVSLACGQVSLLLAWARDGGFVRFLGYSAALIIVVLALLGVLEVLSDDFEIGDRVYGVLMILYLLPVALLPLFTLGRGRPGS